ncbi:hemoglobin protease [Salmonella bongori]|nr:hemoglobin protease [Salmonella bongori]
MNKIYALKYSVRQGALVPVSELATHVKKIISHRFDKKNYSVAAH